MYKIKTEGEGFKQHTIEKVYEETATFSIDDIEAHERKLAEAATEAEATIAYEEAKAENIRTHHAFVKRLKPEQLSTAHLYHTCNMRIQELKDYLKKVNAQQEVYVKEKKEIYEALGFEDAEG